MSMGRIKTGLAVVGTCAALSIVLPPLAGLMNAVGSVTLLALGGYTAYRAWAWMETVVEASRRPTTVRRNLEKASSPEPPSPDRTRSRSRAPKEQAAVPPDDPPERGLRWPGLPAPSLAGLRAPRER
ncbi:MAG: hypothetical protein ABSF27_05595 [Candidatus Dormibacteria bacterium]|jgi:hypothetical protein